VTTMTLAVALLLIERPARRPRSPISGTATARRQRPPSRRTT
jgi:hypothetical protein